MNIKIRCFGDSLHPKRSKDKLGLSQAELDELCVTEDAPMGSPHMEIPINGGIRRLNMSL